MSDSINKKITIDTKEAEKGLDKVNTKLKQTDQELKDAGTQSKRTFGDWVKMFAGITAAAYLFKKAFDFASNFKDAKRDAIETGNKFNEVFSSIQGTANETAKVFAKSFGLASSSAQKLLSDTGNILVGFGMTEKAALDMSVSINSVAQDLVSFTNYSGGVEGASAALTKALLGETESAKSLGIVIRQGTKEFNEQVKSIMANTGATEQQAKTQAIYEQILQQTKKSQGDYARTSDQLANKERALAERYKESKEAIGNSLLPAFNLLVDAQNTMLTLAPKISTFFGWMIQGLSGVGENIGIFVNYAVNSFVGMGKAIGNVAVGVFDTWNGTFEGLGKGLYDFVHGGSFTDIGKAMGEGLASGVNQFDKALKNITDIGLPKFTAAVFEYKEAVKEVAKADDELAQYVDNLNAKKKEEIDLNFRNIETQKTTLKTIEDITNAYEEMAKVEVDTSVTSAEQWELRLSKVQDFYAKYGQAIQGAFQTATMYGQMELAQIDQKYSKEKELIESKFAAGIYNQEQYDQALKKMELKKEKEQKKIHERQKKIDIAMAVTNTAVAITNALRTNPFFPLGLIMSGLAAAQGAIQIATIKAQEFADGGILQGASHAQGGIYAGNNQFVEGGEGVIPRSTVNNPASQPLLNMALQADGRQGFFPENSNGRLGGGTGRAVSSGSSQPIVNVINKIDENGISTMVTRGQNRMQRSGQDLNSVG